MDPVPAAPQRKRHPHDTTRRRTRLPALRNDEWNTVGPGFWRIAVGAILFLLPFGRGKLSALLRDLAEGARNLFNEETMQCA